MPLAKLEPPAPGTFRPKAPADNGELVQLVAVAARAACARPDALPDISGALARACAHLPAPEALTANECLRLWEAFTRALTRLPAAHWQMAGKALLDDLESIGQRLEIMPLVGWDRLPQALDAGLAQNEDTPTPTAITADTAARRLAKKNKKRGRPSDDPLSQARETQERLTALGADELARLLAEAVHGGRLDRGEASLLSRWCRAGVPVAKEDHAVVEALAKVAALVR